MKLSRGRTLRLTLLLALMLPLQGIAAASGCGPFNETSAARQHCAKEAGVALHHACGTCCSLAVIALIPAQWQAPRMRSPQLPLPLLWFPPAVTLDRLDRPPRLLP